MSDYASSRCRRLENKGFPPTHSWQIRSELSVSENGKAYRVKIESGGVSAVFQVDGDIIASGQKCDKFVGVLKDESNGMAIFVELKGKDISHAIEQLEATIKNVHFMPYPKKGDSVRARIVTAGCGPKSSSRVKFEAARIRFKRDYNIELTILKNNQFDRPVRL